MNSAICMSLLAVKLIQPLIIQVYYTPVSFDWIVNYNNQYYSWIETN
jgi:hypothetical protein